MCSHEMEINILESINDIKKLTVTIFSLITILADAQLQI